jgi:hypothetical protein
LSRPARRGTRRSGGFLQGDQWSADGQGLAILDVHLQDFARVSARDLDRRLVGLDFQDALVFLNHVPFAHFDFQDIARINVLAKDR